MGIWDYTLYDYIRHNAAAAGSSPAVIGEGETLTHRQFLERVDGLAAGLAAQGIAKEDRICILDQNSAEYLELYGACAKIGAVAYPINWRLSAEEVREVLKQAEPKMLAVGAGHLTQVGEDLPPGLKIRALIGPGSSEGMAPLADLRQTPGGERFDVGREDPFVVISTAAMAGRPRGAVLTHHNLIMAGYLLIQTLGLTAEDRNLAALPLFHITGLGMALSMVQAGGANVILQKFDPARAVQMMDEHGVTLMGDFPPILSMLLDAQAASGAALGKLKHVLGLDAPDVIQRLYNETGAKFWTGFGQSETTGVGSLGRVEVKPGSTGRPLPLVRVRLVNEAGDDVPTGEAGEIAMQGPVVFSGYWRDPDATQFTFRNGWHHTGDLGKFDAEGYLYYAGRKPEKDLIKSGGENVYPAEVEHAIRTLPEVAAVCVIGVPDETWGEAVKAVIELVPGTTLTADQVSAAVAERIASYKKPRYVDFVDQLPRAPDGGPDRAAIKAAFGSS